MLLKCNVVTVKWGGEGGGSDINIKTLTCVVTDEIKS
jgi:hypothetical protein